MRLNHYRFRSEWRLAAPVDAVWEALEELGTYPAWWPEVRRADAVDTTSMELTCRSLLPYSLVFTSSPSRRDPAAGVLEARLRGDLDGFSRWTVAPSPSGGAVAVFEEEVEATKRLLRVLAPMARPAFRANHALMMWRGRRGLARHLRADDGRRVVRSYFAAWRAGDADRLRSLLAPDVDASGPLASVRGAAAHGDSLARSSVRFDDIVVERVAVDGDEVLAWFSFLLPGGGHAVAAASRIRVERGRVTRVRVTFDPRPLLEGAAPQGIA